MRIGLYSTRDQRRLTLAGEDAGQQSYKVATLSLLPHSENVFLLFKDGWHHGRGRARQHDRRVAVVEEGRRRCRSGIRRKTSCSICTPTTPRSYAEPQSVAVKVNGAQVDTIAVTPRQEFLHKTRITAAQLGTADMVDFTLEVDKTWVPALVPAPTAAIPRELGTPRLPRLCRTGQS